MSNIPRVSFAPRTKGQLMDLAVQARVNGVDYLQVGRIAEEKSRIYHRDIFKELLERLGVNFQMREDNEGPIATKEGEYELRGAGQCWFHVPNTHQFQGRSAGYDKRPHREDLQGLVPFFQKGIRVTIIHPVEDYYIDLGVGEGRE